MYMSDAHQQGKSVKVAVCKCLMSINKETVLKLRFLYVRCQSTWKKCSSYGLYMSDVNQQGKSVQVTVCICLMLNNKEKVLVLKFRYAHVRRQSSRKEVLNLRHVYV